MENIIPFKFIVIYIFLVGLMPLQLLSFPQDNAAGKGKNFIKEP